jgi:hypothetical protein
MELFLHENDPYNVVRRVAIPVRQLGIPKIVIVNKGKEIA